MTLLINIQINLLFKRKFPIGLTSKFSNLVWPNARAALVLSLSPMFYTGFKSLNSVDGLCDPTIYCTLGYLKLLTCNFLFTCVVVRFPIEFLTIKYLELGAIATITLGEYLFH
jgi:hypothetical protein